MDIIPKLPGCDGQAADAVSAYTQVKMEDAPNVDDIKLAGKKPNIDPMWKLLNKVVDL